MEGLAGLLDAARSATPGDDLAGERAAVAGFLAARQRAVPAAPPRRSREVRTTAMKVALGFAVLAFSGTALAARAGSLPPAAQERAHALLSGVGVPAPASNRVVTPTAQPSAGGATTSAVPSLVPTPTRSGPGGTTALELCRVWVAAGQDPPGKAVPAPTRRALAAAAGGQPEIDGFCAGVLGTPAPSGSVSPSPTTGPSEPPTIGEPTATGKPTTTGKPAETGKPTVKPSHPGKGHGTGKPTATGKDQRPGE